jgi:hypothetical protein
MPPPPQSTGSPPHVRRAVVHEQRGWLFFSATEEHLYMLADGTSYTHGGGPAPGATSIDDAIAHVLKHTASDYDVTIPTTGVGEYHPRIYRPTYGLDFARHPAAIASRRAGAQVLRQLETCFEAIEPVAANLATYGHITRQVLVLACMDVEAAWKAVLRANGAGDRKRAKTNHYIRLLEPMALAGWGVTFTDCPDLPTYTPFANWDAKSPSASLPWYDAYNAVKHDRETDFPRATLEAAINACAASIIMLVAQFGPDVVAPQPAFAVPLSGYALLGTGPLPPMHVLGPYRLNFPDLPLAEDYVPPTLFTTATFDERPSFMLGFQPAAQQQPPPPWVECSHPALLGILA